MNILFYITPPPTQNEKLLFKEDWVQFMVGQTVTHKGHTYQVNALQWVDDTRKELKAFCNEVSGSCNNINLDAVETNNIYNDARR